ncbi:MAG TPA: Fe-S-containing protein [Candidatus Solibacter sp.]|jgi:high-affinity iron transporter|nr:Fe-S-containing protein [Candidatus Solibacter sp.]
MLQALIVTLREGIEAALIVGITLAYLTKIGRTDLRKAVYAGLIAAFTGSVAGAVVLSRLGLNSDAFEGCVELVAAFFVVGMVIFMMRAARKLKGEIESKIGSLASGGSHWGVFAFVFLMVFREGVETVLILSGVSLNSTQLMSFIGTLLGVALAMVFGVMFVKGSVRINLQKFFRVTSVILFFIAAQLVITGLHDLSEAGILPPSKREMALVGPIVRNDAFFFVAILALTGLMVLLEYRRQRPDMAVAASKAEERKLQWMARRERLWAVTLCLTTFVFMAAITVEFVYAKSSEVISKADAIALDGNGQVKVPVADLQVGDLHRYSVNIDGTDVRFFLFRKSADKVEAVFDACQICGSMGFYKTSHGVACKNCASPINPESVGQSGGCNPIPLQSVQEKDSQGNVSAVIVSRADLSRQVGLFK